MKAAMFYGPGDLRLEEVPEQQPAPGEITVEVRAAATCGTDLKSYRRGHPKLFPTLPARFGHEFAGVVAAVGDDVEVASLVHFDGADVDRQRQRAGIEQGARHEVGMLGSNQVVEAAPEDGSNVASEQRGRVLADLAHAKVFRIDIDQEAMRLYAARNMDRFAVAGSNVNAV